LRGALGAGALDDEDDEEEELDELDDGVVEVLVVVAPVL
jgi:hypothetical protein